jgi:hypothetical protein
MIHVLEQAPYCWNGLVEGLLRMQEKREISEQVDVGESGIQGNVSST